MTRTHLRFAAIGAVVAAFIAAPALLFGQTNPLPGQIGDQTFKTLTVQEGQTLGAFSYGVDAGANDTYVATIAPAPAAYITGALYVLKANTANTGAATVNFNGLGAKTIVKAVNTTLANNDILAGMLCLLVYDGTNMVLLNPRAL